MEEKRVRLTFFEKMVRNYVQHYNAETYWKIRKRVITEYENANIIKKLVLYYFLYKIKRMDAFNGASMGTHLGYGAVFDDIPSFPHGIYGIVISHHAHIGRNCTILHHVTIGGGDSAPIIGDNVLIGTGAIVYGDGIRIGNNVKIGAGCIVTENIPDNCTVVMQKPRIIKREYY